MQTREGRKTSGVESRESEKTCMQMLFHRSTEVGYIKVWIRWKDTLVAVPHDNEGTCHGAGLVISE